MLYKSDKIDFLSEDILNRGNRDSKIQFIFFKSKNSCRYVCFL